MRRPRRSSTGARRDDGVRVIRTNNVRYPDADLPPGAFPAEQNEADGRGGRLGPARDTGIAVESRSARQQRARERDQRRLTVVAVSVAIALMLALAGWRVASDKRAAGSPLYASAAAAGAAGESTPIIGGHASGRGSGATYSAMGTQQATPTPYFARYGKLLLRLPVPLDDLTEVGFHQASYEYARPLQTRLPDANLTLAAKNKGTGRDLSKQSSAADAWLVGTVIRMWRARPGRPNTAADVGGLAGTPILSPVTGTIVKIKSYKLYGRYPDYEVHIHADGFDDVDVVMIHVKDLTVAPGDKVIAGITQIGCIRKFSDKFHDQLADYTKGGGDHVHMAVNNANDPKYKGLQGAIDPNEF